MATAPHPRGEQPTEDSPSDADLIIATRGGDTSAYGELYARHLHAANRLARILARDGAEADDLVSETFAKVLTTLRGGRGPDLAFRAYLLTAMRNTFYDRVRRERRVEYTDDMTRHDHGEPFEDPAVAGMERRFAARAFRQLPERWQTVLWHTEVEGESPREVARLLGLTPNGVSALAYRARERLRMAFLQEHAADAPAPDCRWTAERLGARVREGLSPRDVQKVDCHLDDCTACKLLFAELGELNQGIPAVLAFAVLGASGTPYLAAAIGKIAAGLGAAGAAGGVWGWLTGLGAKVRHALQQGGGKTAAVAGGIAVVAAVLALVMVANETPPEPPAAQPPQLPPVVTPTDEPAPPEDPPEEPPEDPPSNPPAPPDAPPPDDPAPEEPDEPAPSKELAVTAPELGESLTAGDSGVLPITVRSPEHAYLAPPPPGGGSGGGAGTGLMRFTDEDQVVLVAELPDGVGLADPDAGDGWTCAEGDGPTVRCTRDRLAPGTSSTARVELDIPADVSGFQSVTVSVSAGGRNGEADLRVAIAPPGMRTAYADTHVTGVAVTGNTLMMCRHAPGCLQGPLLDNHTRRMEPWTGDDGDTAASTAELELPPGARVAWAALYWAASEESVPGSVHLSGPGGERTLSPERTFTGAERPVTQAVAEVTDLITAGTWRVSTDAGELPEGIMNYGGWSLVVVYDTGTDKDVAVYEGLAQPRHGATLDLGLPHRGDVTVGYVLWDGDRTLHGDGARLGDTPVGTPGNLGRGDCPGSDLDHTLGVDAAAHTVDAAPGEDVLSITSGFDPIDIGVLATAA